ncbi:hypothetical protein Hanom_Chr09g00768411 [Helianthus anomalus]
MESDSDEDSVDMKDLEEGEIKQNQVGNDGNHEKHQFPATIVEDDLRNVQPENNPVGVDQSQEAQVLSEDQSTPEVNAGGNLFNVHGDEHMAAHGCNINEGNIEDLNLNFERSDGPSPFNPGVNTYGIFNEKVGDGPTPTMNLGKRNRDERNPPSIGSVQGPTQRLYCAPFCSNIEPLDLNTPVRADSGHVGHRFG